MLDSDRHHLIEEECGIFAVCHHTDAAKLVRLGLHNLQHRGQEAVGIASMMHGRVHLQKRHGLVADQVDAQMLAALPGAIAMGHVRYRTSGYGHLRDAQPLVFSTRHGQVALAHNGNITNAQTLRTQCEAAGAVFKTESDTEVIAQLMKLSNATDVMEALVDALKQVTGAFALIGMTPTCLFALRDPYGVRPLVVGHLEDATVFSSETCAFFSIQATFKRALRPGELYHVELKDRTQHSTMPFDIVKPRPCIFELVYFSRADSVVFDRDVYQVRQNMGRLLAHQHPVAADVVVAVPDSGAVAAIAYATQSALPYAQGFVRHRSIGRTFIESDQTVRKQHVSLKLSPIISVVKGKRVVVVDDSIVRGTTAQQIVTMLRLAGAKEVHFRVASPPTIAACFYGINTPDRQELIAYNQSIESIRSTLNADTLGFLSMAGLRESIDAGAGSFCEACFTNEYPIDLADHAMDES